jgi:hypothetical protein
MNIPLEKTKKFLNKKSYENTIDIVYSAYQTKLISESKQIFIAKANLLGVDLIAYTNFVNFIKTLAQKLYVNH